MTDSKPKDSALAKSQMDFAIQKKGAHLAFDELSRIDFFFFVVLRSLWPRRAPLNTLPVAGESSVNTAKAPADRAITEALTLRAISAAPKLKKTETVVKEGLSADEIKQLQDDAQQEKDRKEKARQFGGGDAKAGMTSILGEINSQGGIIAVPSDKAPKANVALSHAKTLMEITALGGEPIYASGTDHKVKDTALEQAKTAYIISKKGEASVNADKIKTLESKGANQAQTMMALSAGVASLKKVE